MRENIDPRQFILGVGTSSILALSGCARNGDGDPGTDDEPASDDESDDDPGLR